MPNLTIMPSGKTMTVAEGATVLSALLDADVGVVSKCNGNAKCGACHIYVHDGRKSLTRTTREENAKLDEIVGVSSKSRLACQAKFGSENVTVEVLGFGSGF